MSMTARLGIISAALGWFVSVSLAVAEEGLVAHWPLTKDGRDAGPSHLDAVDYAVDWPRQRFDGRRSRLEVADAPPLHFGVGDFTLLVQVLADPLLTDERGDIVSKFDPISRRGFTLSLAASAAGYNGAGDSRHVHFGLGGGGRPENGEWIDCGRPGGKSHNSDALTVFDGRLYAGVTDAPDVADWAHVYCYAGGQEWRDCGRLGQDRTRGVYAMTVHQGDLYAATSASHGPQPASMSFGRVYRYRGGDQWQDIGQPGRNYRINALASFNGQLYACGFNIGPDPGHVYVYEPQAAAEGGESWRAIGEFPGWPHALAVHDGELFMAYPHGEVFAYNGSTWRELGNPFGSREECNQIHSLGVFGGELLAGTWPKGRVAALREGGWVDLGRPGDATEVIGLAAYNGSLYAGTIPRAEIFRWEQEPGATANWRSIRRLFDPPGYEPVPVGSADGPGVADWSRASSLTVFGDSLYVSTATCYRTMMERPRPDEIRGRVFAWKSGHHVAHDRDLGSGWRRLAAVRQGGELRLFVDGVLVARSAADPDDEPIDVSTSAPLQIGFGPKSHFEGGIRDLRIYNRALSEAEIAAQAD